MKTINRRRFIQTSAAVTAASAAPFNILKAGPSPNSKLNIACIGVGRQGAGNAGELAQKDNIIGFCDVDEPWHKRAIAGHKNLHSVKLWRDYRKMFDQIGKEIDAVLIATPEHVHYAASMYAIRNGKHVYCQKPLCHTVNECRLLAEESKKHPKVITQMGHQGHSSQSSALIRDWVKAKAVGEIREVLAYSRKNYWTDKPIKTGETAPDTLDWNLFLNRAEEIPYSSSYMNREWIRYSHFSGAVGDMGAHILDPAYYSLDLRVPLTVRADVKIPAIPGSLPRAGVITWTFGARGKLPPVTMKYYLGPDIEFPWPTHLEEGRRAITSGSCLVGEGASITAGSHSQSGRIVPETRMQETEKPPAVSPRCKGRGHFENWTLAIKGEDTNLSPFEYAGPLSEIIVLGDVALLHPNVTLEWDAANMKITNNEEANRSLFMRRIDPRDELNWC